MTQNRKFTSNDEKNKDYNTKLVLTAGVLLLGAFFAINPSSLIAFADVDPEMINFTSAEDGPVHPGDLLVVDKNVTLTQSINGEVNVTVSVYNEGTMDPCVDPLGVTVLSLTTANVTTNIPSPSDGFLLYNETFVGMPGVYHCNVVFDAVNATDAGNSEQIGNQTVWIDGIGSKGYWKNHPEATDLLLWKLVGNYNVTNSTVATELFDAHKGKFDLDKLAGQLLAAMLNIMALDGQSDTTCIDGNVTAANTTLADKMYGGPNDPTGKLKKSEKAPALELHGNLDEFNNYGCPLP